VIKRRIAIVVQRYGPEVTGGSESLARAIAERLTEDHHVTVLTTRAKDYITWRNELPEGTETLNNVEVKRFSVEKERDLDSFNRFSDDLYARPHSKEEEEEWLERQGPHAPRLIDHLAKCKYEFDAILFFTYLYYPTYWGLKTAPERSILVPTAHDEPPLRLEIFQDVFKAPQAFAFCSAPEEELVKTRFGTRNRPSGVIGIGIETPEQPDVEGFRIRHDLRGPYVLYAGRIDAGKGCAEMIDFYTRYRRDCRGAAQLLLIGKMAMPMPRAPGVRYLGYLSESEKFAAIAGARAMLCPSPYESLSISLLEALSLGTPALVSSRSPVLLDHALRSKAALHYSCPDEFTESLDLLVREEPLCAALAESGRRYVRDNYRWDVVIEKYRALIAAVYHRPSARP
jgi:glycosyltransferase involved in cell wall biosynthesis